MTFTTLSLLVPMRGHPERRTRMWDSLQATAPSVELVIRLDDDDAETYAWADALVPRPVIVVGPRLQGYASLPVFFNEMAKVATGDLLMCGNDDMTFCTPGWADRYLQLANAYPDGVFNLGCMTYPAGAFPFSCVSRRVVDALGFLNDTRLIYSDIFLRDVLARFGRALFLPEIVIQHIGIADKATQDVKWAVHFDADAYWALHNRCVSDAAAKISPLLQKARAHTWPLLRRPKAHWTSLVWKNAKA